MCEEKGPHRARRRAHGRCSAHPRRADSSRAGNIFREAVAPHLDGERVTYVGEVGGDIKLNLFADDRGLLMPIGWSEPFGMVMVEALSAGTPVIAFANGAAPEIVEDGISGYLVTDEAEMATKIALLDEIDPAACRDRAAARVDIHHVAAE